MGLVFSFRIIFVRFDYRFLHKAVLTCTIKGSLILFPRSDSVHGTKGPEDLTPSLNARSKTLVGSFQRTGEIYFMTDLPVIKPKKKNEPFGTLALLTHVTHCQVGRML